PLFNLLNRYALRVGVFGLVVLCAYGANSLAWRAGGEPAVRARRWARRLWWAEVALFVGMIGPTYAVRDEMLTNLSDHPWRLVFALLAVAGVVALLVCQRRERPAGAFFASCLFLAGLLATLAAGIYPNVLPAHDDRPFSLTVHNA